MNLNKNQREVRIPVSACDFEGPIDQIPEKLRAAVADRICMDPELETAYSWNDSDFEIVGWRPATDKEIERAKKASERSKHANAMKKAKKEERERLEYERLRKKFENEGT